MTAESSVAMKSATHSSLVFERLHTYFLFPFALDKQAIQNDHPQAWPGKSRWMDCLDAWIAGETARLASNGLCGLGPWRRATYSSFDLDSPAYADLLFFHPIVRRVFFDTKIGRLAGDGENQLRCYTIAIDAPAKLWFEGTDALGGRGRAQVTDLRLYLSAQGIGVLSIGIETAEIDAAQALWINRRLRKLYPLDSDSVRDGRTPNWLALRLERDTKVETICEERFTGLAMAGFNPPLPNTVKSLLYFAEYSQEEYEPVHDENMLVYSYAEVDGTAASAQASPDAFDSLVEDFLYLGHKHGEPEQHVFGSATVLFGFTSHSCSLLRIHSGNERISGPRTGRALSSAIARRDGMAVVRTFHTRYYLMAVVALFYRAVLLDFSERAALASRRLMQDEQSGRLTLPSITIVNDMRIEFLNFNSYWHFDDLSTKQVDNDLFRRVCCEYRIAEMKDVLASELGYMAEFVYNFYQLRTTEAVNRLAILSLIFGGGAVLTGFFGMNFEREFGQIFFAGEGAASLAHYFMVALVCTVVFGSLALGIFVVLRNWRDYLAFLKPPTNLSSSSSLKRNR